MSEKRFPWWMRIKARVLVFGVLMSAVPLLILGLASFTAAQAYLEESIQKQNSERAALLAGQIQDFIQNNADSLIQVTSTNALELVGADPLARETVLGTMLRGIPYLESLQVADPQVQVLGKVSRREVDYPVQAGETLPCLDFSASESYSLSEVFFSVDGRPQVYLTVNIIDPQTRRNLGYLQAKTDLKALFNKFTSIQIGQEGIIYLTDGKGKLIGHSDFSRVLSQEDMTRNPSVRNFLAGKPPSLAGNEYPNTDDTPVLGLYAPVGSPPWGVFIEQPVQEAYEPIARFALRVMGMMLVIILGVTLISIYFGLKLTQPIENLEAGVRRIIATEDLQAEVTQESDDEIGRLVQAFNNLLRRLADKTANLQAEQELLETVVHGIGAGMALLDQEKRLIWWNSLFARWFGSENKNFKKLACEELLRGEGPESSFEENGRVLALEVQGDKRYLRHSYYRLNSGNPENAAYLLLLEDVTQQVEMEARVIQTEKMATVGLLASGVAHEINNPLAILSAHNEDLLDRLQEEGELPGKAEIEGILSIIAKQIERCKQVTGRLLGYARPGRHGPDRMDANNAIEQTAALLAYRLKQKKMVLIKESEPGLWVEGDENEWQQVVLNILTNAIDASAEGSQVIVRAQRVKRPFASAEALPIDKGDEIQIEVEDQGQGISAQYLKKVFDPFFTTKPPGQGTGLGLFVSYGIVQKMQGKLFIESTEGKGTTVRINLPFQGRGVGHECSSTCLDLRR
ncbi:histidine kinase [Desulfitobacterium hafniense DCB-2]|uniref:histidine kinase n=1 Tax=Desulfitobacterium hafniense (strain DSM 10664 / DCB-2) TaxID=272564 RepID=B8FZ23_DESHD|nr:PAS domain-containing sensor histidine kinase [Desulfitobacterium hafniense]ACL22775.1 histidine kinase [Desulfitobacterium hafniense DCB-2]